MNEPLPQEITDLLLDWSNGDKTAFRKLTPLVYEELRRMASRYMRNEQAGHTMLTTDLVHEAYIRLKQYKEIQWRERAHFFAIAAQVMRRILVEQARARHRVKRGGNAVKVSLDGAAVLSLDQLPRFEDRYLELIALDEALTRLACVELRKSQVVEMRYFGGLSNEEIAEVLGVTPNTVMRDWKYAKAWLHRELSK